MLPTAILNECQNYLGGGNYLGGANPNPNPGFDASKSDQYSEAASVETKS